MVPSNAHVLLNGAEETVVGSIDVERGRDTFVIADIAADGAWVSMDAADAPTLPEWR